MLKVSSLTRSYGSFKAVDGVAFEAEQGQIVGLLGHNGAGKTTIMKMLTGFLEPDSGEVELGGVKLAEDPASVQACLGYLPESLPVYPELIVADYLDYAAELKGIAESDRVAEIRRVVSLTGIQEKILSPISTLSRGYKQRVGVAQAILGKPKLLILDEPTNGLDPTQTEQMRKLIQDISSHATVIVSTHIMQEVEAVCDRVLILKDGRLVFDEVLEELNSNNELLVRTSLGPDVQEQFLALEGVESSQHDASSTQDKKYTLRLKDEVDGDLVAAQVAKVVLDSEGSLFEIRPTRRDLESLFHELNQPLEENHAE